MKNHLKKVLTIALFLQANLIPSFVFTYVPNSLSFQIQSQNNQAIKCIILCIGNNKDVEHIANMIKFDLEFTDQLTADVKKYSEHLSPDLQKKLFEQQQVSLCLQCSPSDDNKNISIELKDSFSEKPLFIKNYPLESKNVVHQAHIISEDILPKLTGSNSIALSTLAFCKQVNSHNKRIFISDYSCKKERCAVSFPRLNVAPRWHSTLPQLFFSQLTHSNGRLMVCNINKNTSNVVCSYDGLNMQPAFSPTGEKVVLCLSARNGNSELYLYDPALCKKAGRRVYVPLTNNGGNNTSPCILPDGDVVFCSDFQTGLPQLYHLDMKKKKIHRLTNGSGYCAAPSYCEKTNSIIYTKPVNNIFQLWAIDLDEERIAEKQLTFGSGDKLDPAYSPCGNYVAFTYDYVNEHKKRIPQIAMLNLASKKIRILTTDSYPKSFPTWTSGTYYQ